MVNSDLYMEILLLRGIRKIWTCSRLCKLIELVGLHIGDVDRQKGAAENLGCDLMQNFARNRKEFHCQPIEIPFISLC